MRISDWSSDVCSSDLRVLEVFPAIRCVADGEALAGGGIHAASLQIGARVVAGLQLLGEKPRSGIERGIQRLTVLVVVVVHRVARRSEEHTSELQSLMSISYAVFCLKKKIHNTYAVISYKKQTRD